MPGTATNVATNKTEFQRYLNDNPRAVKTLLRLSGEYAANPRGKDTFGFWLRVKHRRTFDIEYRRWWLKHPKRHGVIYKSLDPQIL